MNDEFLALVPKARYKIVITDAELGDALSATEWTADSLNRRAVEKFSLPS